MSERCICGKDFVCQLLDYCEECCPAVVALTTRLAVVEKERDEWKRSSELVARVLIDTKADLTAARVVVAMARAEVAGTDCWKWEEGGCLMFDEPQCPYCDLRDAIAALEEPKCGTCKGSKVIHGDVWHCGRGHHSCWKLEPTRENCDKCSYARPFPCPECDQGKE